MYQEPLYLLERLAARLIELQDHPPDEAELAALRATLASLEERLLLCQDEASSQGAFLLIRPESEQPDDEAWSEAMRRMYEAWVDARGFRVERFAFAEGAAAMRETGLEVRGRSAFAMLRGEAGLHWLRDARGAPSTACAEVMVFPTWRQRPPSEYDLSAFELRSARGFYGLAQGYLNRMSRATRATHRPSGRSIACEWRRGGQFGRALFLLEQRLAQGDEAPLKCRTYQLGERPVVRDHRRGLEEGDVQAVLDGRLEPFIRAALREPLRLLRL